MGRFADLRVSVNDNEGTVNRNQCGLQCANTVSIPRETGVKKYLAKRVVIVPYALYNQNVQRYPTNTVPLTPPRALIVRAHALEIFISAAAITLGIFVWLSMKDSNSGINLLAGAALVVAGKHAFIYLAYFGGGPNGNGVFWTVGPANQHRWLALAIQWQSRLTRRTASGS